MKILSGVMVPLVTPHHQPDLFPLVDHVLKGEVSNLFILGTTGESLKLSQKFKIELIEKVASHVGSRAKLFVGVTSTSLTDTLELIKASHAVGARASVVVPSLLGDNISTVLDTLLSLTSGDLLLYNNPALTGNISLPVEEMAQFFGENRIIGIKDSSGDFAYLNHLIQARGDRLISIFYGREHKLREALRMEINGIVPGCANVDPKLLCQLWEEKEDGPWKRWAELKAKVQEMNPDHYLTGLKLLLKQQDIITDARLW